ncbi:site-specific integrase [Halioglobus sp. HI00S01]|uniref:site-specific integrase n=1 Tax=Halioglobus sp. HI00S01 TaxID=1822214 RepID=UPI0018D4AB06|nr:site-specific integrase [Halioglobus sp. HI00S01]
MPDGSVPLDKWLSELAEDLDRDTLNQYKASLVFYLGENDLGGAADAVAQIDPQDCQKKTYRSGNKRTSALKLKCVPEEFERELTDKYLAGSYKGHWGVRCLVFFKATILTGLRPSEWKTAKLVTWSEAFGADGPVLVVRNGKNSNGRSHGEKRHLLLSSLDEQELQYVKLQLLFLSKTDDGLVDARGHELGFDQYYKQIQKRLYEFNKKYRRSKTKTVTIYSCRHQFIANLKRAGYSRPEIAALCGHANDRTASETYGRRRFGNTKKGLPKPSQLEVEKIKLVIDSRRRLSQTLVADRSERAPS